MDLLVVAAVLTLGHKLRVVTLVLILVVAAVAVLTTTLEILAVLVELELLS
jgi:hypothetical protein